MIGVKSDYFLLNTPENPSVEQLAKVLLTSMVYVRLCYRVHHVKVSVSWKSIIIQVPNVINLRKIKMATFTSALGHKTLPVTAPITKVSHMSLRLIVR